MVKHLSLLLLALALAACSKPSSDVTLRDEDGKLVFSSSGRDLLAYQYSLYPAPEGEKPSYSRSGFIHPLWSPNGTALTNIQPPDHFHHYGIWNPWTHVQVDDKIVDFWNIGGGQGTVRFNGIVSKEEGHGVAEIAVNHEHVVFPEDGEEFAAIHETQTIRVQAQPGADRYLVDIDIELTPDANHAITLLEYRYGGFSWRATDRWNSENSSVLTSEGKTRLDADGSLARWCMAQGLVDGANSGLVMMSHPSNYNHPEPLRVWPGEMHDGNLFANFSPTKNRDWPLPAGETQTLRYRLLVFSGPMDAATAESAWQAFAEN